MKELPQKEAERVVRVEESALVNPNKKVFDPRRDKLLDITAEDDNFEQSLRYFQPPVEQPDESL